MVVAATTTGTYWTLAVLRLPGTGLARHVIGSLAPATALRHYQSLLTSTTITITINLFPSLSSLLLFSLP